VPPNDATMAWFVKYLLEENRRLSHEVHFKPGYTCVNFSEEKPSSFQATPPELAHELCYLRLELLTQTCKELEAENASLRQSLQIYAKNYALSISILARASRMFCKILPLCSRAI